VYKWIFDKIYRTFITINVILKLRLDGYFLRTSHVLKNATVVLLLVHQVSICIYTYSWGFTWLVALDLYSQNVHNAELASVDFWF
jgi:hypothetical protein